MKICMLTTIHPPFDTRIFHKESKSLLKAGHSVTIVAPHDSKDKKNVDGINIVTVKKPGSKILHPITLMRVFIAGLRQDCDVYHCHEPGSLFVCILLKILRRKKLVYDAHEYFPELIARNSFFPVIIRPIIEKICLLEEKVMCIFPDIIITVDQVLLNYYQTLSSEVVIISNYAIINSYTEKVEKYPHHTIVYAGALTKERGIFELIQAYEGIIEKIPDARLLIIGNFVDSVFENYIHGYIDSKMLKGVRFTGFIPHEQVIVHLKKSVIGAIILQPVKRYKKAVPVKLFEYMMSEIPVIISDFEFNREIMQDTNCGIVVDPENIREIIKALYWLFAHPVEAKEMGKNGRKAVEEKYNWEIMEKRLFEIYEEIA
ncbi:MAG: glycosyltransferase family 4 protein [Methanosarcinales archaeon]